MTAPRFVVLHNASVACETADPCHVIMVDVGRRTEREGEKRFNVPRLCEKINTHLVIMRELSTEKPGATIRAELLDRTNQKSDLGGQSEGEGRPRIRLKWLYGRSRRAI